MRNIKLLAAAVLATMGRILSAEAVFTAGLSLRLTRAAQRLRDDAARSHGGR